MAGGVEIKKDILIENTIKELVDIKNFVIAKGEKKLIDIVKPILNSIIEDLKKGKDESFFSNNNENLVKSLAALKLQGHILSSDEKKILEIAQEIQEDNTTQNLSNLDDVIAEKYFPIEKNLVEKIKKLNNELGELEKSSEVSTKNLQNTFKEMQEDLNIHTADIKEKFETELEEFRNYKRALIEDTKLSAAREYWQEKAAQHKKSANWLFAAFIIPVVIIVITIFVKLDYSSLNESSILQDSNITMPGIVQQAIPIMHYIPYVLVLSLLIWLSRIALKIAFSNLHLKEEAHEKETQILTYLALINEDARLDSSDRKLILEAIFRPSTNGLIKDESNVTLLDIANIFKGK